MKFPKVIYNGDPKPHSWCRWSVHRVKRRNDSTNIRFTGDTGSGKSWSALAWAEIMGKMLGVEIGKENIFFSITDAIKKVDREDPKPGTIFFIDEQQVGSEASEHNTLKGKAYTAFFSTVRSKRYIIITTMPFADMIIKKVRRFFHVEVETLGANMTNNTVKAKARMLEYSRQTSKVYQKRMHVVFRDKSTGLMKVRKIDYDFIPKPSQRLIDLFEPMKQEFQRNLYRKIVKDLEKFEGPSEEEKSREAVATENTLQSLTDYQLCVYEAMQNGARGGKQISEYVISKGFKSDPGKVSVNLKWMKKKGVIVLRSSFRQK